MDQRNYPVPRTGFTITVDLDDRDPLLNMEAEALIQEQSRLIRERERLNEDIRKVSQRLLLSAEKKVQMMRDDS